MPKLTRSYIENPEVQPDGSVHFACSGDIEEWPWLALPPQHPLVIQTQNFWASVGATEALQSRDESKWSALTWTRWQLGDKDAGRAARGVFSRSGGEGNLTFSIALLDASERLIAELTGKGVVFRNRNFEEWRKGSKADAFKVAVPPADFTYASREALGLSQAEPPLIAPMTTVDGAVGTAALVTKQNGLMPGHPFFSGSGDHVNAPHLAELSRQAACLCTDNPALHVQFGEMDMHRYIELGTPIDLKVTQQADDEIRLNFSQLGKSCAATILRW
ncbi:MAG: hypothetical protein ABJ242_01515 [Marinomonas sp.]|uniref:hypothetical protein n=1 Tax=Parasphingorhabdus sp. TaxID=2709688 RepID=UPI00326A4A15